MRITYDPDVDALYAQFRAAKPVHGVDLGEGVTADIDADGHVAGIEVLDAKERFGDSLESVTFERLTQAATEGGGAVRALWRVRSTQPPS